MKSNSNKLNDTTDAMAALIESMCTMIAIAKEFGLKISEVDKAINSNNNIKSD